MRTKETILQHILLLITTMGLLLGACSPMVVSQPTAVVTPTATTPTTVAAVTSYHLEYTKSYSEKDLRFQKSLGYDQVAMNGCASLSEIGNPRLPAQHLMIALPNGMKATGIRILSAQQERLPGRYTVFPAQRPQPVGIASSTITLERNTAAYVSFLPYPSSLVSLGPQSDLAGQSMISVTIYPLHYLPLQKELTFVHSLRFVIDGVSGYVCGDYLPQTLSEPERVTYTQMIKGMVINPADVELHTSPNPQPAGVPAGDYDYVIVTKDSWTTAFQPLADWKTQKGVPATIVTTNWIYNSGGYSGTDVQKIKAFVQDAYTTWGTTYVLLGGDIDTVPCNTKTFSYVDPDPVPNDAYYADFDADYVCEVNIGRASVSSTGNGTGGIANFIYKVMTYETNPPLSNYAKKAALLGFDLDSWTEAEQCKININNSYIPDSWTVKTVYDSQSGNHYTNVINALNAGQNLVNHADHSNNDCMGVGYVNHNYLLYDSDMDDLTNGNKQTILYSMGCDPAAYDVDDCIAEHFVQNTNGGGIAFVGNSRYGWYEWSTYDTLSMGYDVHFFKSLFSDGIYNLGATFSDHKNDGYQENPGDDYYQYIFTELTLLGDPELPIWTENPTNLTVTHPGSLPMGTSMFNVTVTAGGNPVNQAYVCLWKGTEVYQRGYTDASGFVSFTVSPTSGGNMNVTVTKHNYIPNRSTAQVATGNVPPYLPSAPSPANGATGVSLGADLSWTGGDPNQGDIVTYDVYFGTSSNPPRVANNQSATTYDPGALAYATTYYWKIVSWDNYGAFTTGTTWSFTTKANTPPVYGAPTPANGSVGNPLALTWSIPIGDPDGDAFSWTLQCSNGQTSSGTYEANGTKSLSLANLDYAMVYKVWVNATDPSGSGTYTRRWYTFDTLGDSTAPVTVIAVSGTSGQHGWYISPVVVTLTATDTQSGVQYTKYMVDSGNWTTYTGPFTVSADGSHTVSYYSVDAVGNTETPNTAPCKIDQTKPTITLTKQQLDLMDVTFTAQVTDATSGVDRVEFYQNGGLQFNDTQAPYTWTWTGTQDDVVLATVFDLAGNSQSQSMHTSLSLQYGIGVDQLQFQSVPLKLQQRR